MTTVRTALDRLAHAAKEIPTLESPYELEEPTLGPPCCAAELDELREQLGGDKAFPDEYLEFLGFCRRVVAMDVYNGYMLYSPLELGCLGAGAPTFIQVPDTGTHEEVFVVSIGRDGGGNQFLMATSSNLRGAVWKWDHASEVRFDGMGKEGLTLVAHTFAAFLHRVAEDWEAFLRDDRGWKYVSG